MTDPTVRHFPAFKVDVFDTNGCGDTFHGAFALAVARRLTVEEAITFASASAALKATAAGGQRRGWDALPTLDEVSRFLQATLKEPEEIPIVEQTSSSQRSRALGEVAECYGACRPCAVMESANLLPGWPRPLDWIGLRNCQFARAAGAHPMNKTELPRAIRQFLIH